ncbi:MAG: FAD-binding protein [Gammaproteobacteria bacterium]|nr:FAD-binding protein [Gammaproteobacteria bacterium]
MATLTPSAEAEVLDVVRWALAHDEPLALEGGGSRRGFGHPVTATQRLSLHALAGIECYQPAELVLRVRPGTPLAQVEATLAAHRQQLAFEPPYPQALYGVDGGTIGGVFVGNLAGPRRWCAGSARDHLLGLRVVTGRGDIVKSGGAVIKNVTGFDLGKLVCGSWGTLAAVTELTCKVVPAAATCATIVLTDLDPAAGIACMSRIAASALDASALAYLPAGIGAGLDIFNMLPAGAVVTAARFEGSAISVPARLRQARQLLQADASVCTLDAAASTALWSAVRDVEPLRGAAVVVRISLPVTFAAGIIAWLAATPGVRWMLDHGGSLIWAALPEAGAVAAIAELRRRVGPDGAVVLYVAPAAVQRAAGVLSPQPPPLAALTRRVREAFDPRGILNPGRLS